MTIGKMSEAEAANWIGGDMAPVRKDVVDPV
jgi:hypothetical protein